IVSAIMATPAVVMRDFSIVPLLKCKIGAIEFSNAGLKRLQGGAVPPGSAWEPRRLLRCQECEGLMAPPLAPVVLTVLPALLGFSPIGGRGQGIAQHRKNQPPAHRRRFLEPHFQAHAEWKAFAAMFADQSVRGLVMDPALISQR